MKAFYEFSAFIDYNSKLKRVVFDVKVDGPRPKKEQRFEAARTYLARNYEGFSVKSLDEVAPTKTNRK